MKASRSLSAFKNTIVAFASYALTMTTNLVFRGVFINLLDKTYLGMQGLFSNIIAFLSLVEMGAGAAIIFSLYKPLSENDQDKIRAYVCFYRQIYCYIALAVFILGTAIMPFLDFFIESRPQIPESLETIYFLFVLNSATSYLFSYRLTVLHADQKAYIINFWNSFSSIARNILQIVWLYVTRNYIGTLIIQMLVSIITNLLLNRLAVKQFPYLKDLNGAQKISQAEQKDLKTRIGTLFLYRVGSYTINSTDNILISKFFGFNVLANLTNYYFLLGVVNSIGNMIASSLTPSVGNQAAALSNRSVKSTFLTLQFLYTWLSVFATACLAALLTPFIWLWAGPDFVIPSTTMALMVLNFYLTFKRRLMGVYRNALGLYLQAKSMAIVQGLLNLVFSLFLLKRMGVIGVILGTTLSDMMVSMWVDPYVLYKYYFKESMLEYWKEYFGSALLTFGMSSLLFFISQNVFVGTISSFLLLMLICLLLPNLLMFLLFRKNKHFQVLLTRAKHILYSRRKIQKM